MTRTPRQPTEPAPEPAAVTTSRAHLAPGRSVSPGDFADLTATKVKGIERDDTGAVVVVWDGDVPADVDAAARRRIMSATPREEVLRAEAEAWLAMDSPTSGDLHDQVRRLTELLTGRQ